MEVGFESTDQEFCDLFVKGVAQTNGMKLVDGFRFGCFGDKAKEGGIKLLGNFFGF